MIETGSMAAYWMDQQLHAQFSSLYIYLSTLHIPTSSHSLTASLKSITITILQLSDLKPLLHCNSLMYSHNLTATFKCKTMPTMQHSNWQKGHIEMQTTYSCRHKPDYWRLWLEKIQAVVNSAPHSCGNSCCTNQATEIQRKNKWTTLIIKHMIKLSLGQSQQIFEVKGTYACATVAWATLSCLCKSHVSSVHHWTDIWYSSLEFIFYMSLFLKKKKKQGELALHLV